MGMGGEKTRRTSKTKVTESGVICRNQEVRCLPERRGKGSEERRREMIWGGGKGDNMGLKTVGLVKRVKEVEVFSKVRLKDRTAEKDVKFIPEGEGTVGTVTVDVREVETRGGVVVLGR